MKPTRSLLLWGFCALLVVLTQLAAWVLTEYVHTSNQQHLVRFSAERLARAVQERLNDLETEVLLDFSGMDTPLTLKQESFADLHARFPELVRIEWRDASGTLMRSLSEPHTEESRRALPPGLLALFSSANSQRNIAYSSPYYAQEASPDKAARDDVRMDLLIPARRHNQGMWILTLRPEFWLRGAFLQPLQLNDPGLRFELSNSDESVQLSTVNQGMQEPLSPREYWPLSLGGANLQISSARFVVHDEAYEALRWIISGLGGLLAVLASLLVRSMMIRRSAVARIKDLQSKVESDSRVVTLGEMSTAIAHELNQPLGAIENFAFACERLMQRPDTSSEDIIRALQQIRAEAQRGYRVISSIRDFVKRESQSVEILEVSQVLQNLQPLMNLQASKLGARLNFHCPAGLTIQTNRALFEQVILNLARNGLESMANTPPEKRVLTISGSLSDIDGFKQVILRVEDNGCGIEESARAKLFSPFFSTKAGGMGIGLSLCQSIVERSGGSIRWKPRPETGTCFELSLPVAQGVA